MYSLSIIYNSKSFYTFIMALVTSQHPPGNDAGWGAGCRVQSRVWAEALPQHHQALLQHFGDMKRINCILRNELKLT